MAITAGTRVTVRGEQWIVDETTVFPDATLLHLSGAGGCITHRRCRLILPFDRPVEDARSQQIRATTHRRWLCHLHAQLCNGSRFGELRAAPRAAIDILPFQLEPALALVRGQASRFLLADEVGLGKTIQAGLMLAELQQRGWCEHALVVTPAGLRHQWCDELRHRFDMQAALMDAASVAKLAATLPFDVNPWAVEPVAIASIDFLKQPEVLHAPVAQFWDVVIVDEAHQATVSSQRYGAVDALAKRARYVLLLTATPHTGDDHAYRALCAIGKVSPDEPITLFRRTREAAGLKRSRRVHLLPIALTRDAVEMHRLLDEYVAQLWSLAREFGRHDLQLVAMVLAKRAFSSARSLTISLERRLEGLAEGVDAPVQEPLPLSFDEDASDDGWLPTGPAFKLADEHTVLHRLIGAARRAQSDERKMHAIRRILRRVCEPLIIFTECRDTLDAIRDAIGDLRHVTTLHGGQSSNERRQSVQMFTSGTADVMIATDAGSEGLNLQGTCRIVINLELPWNPIRLEQRIGRVDRLGQSRTVHAINLFAQGTAERTVLANLVRRIDRIRMSEIEVAACILGRADAPHASVPAESCAQTTELHIEALAAAQHIARRRACSAVRSKLRDSAVPITVLQSADAALIGFYRIRLVTTTGRLVEEQLLPVCVSLPNLRSPRGRRGARALAESLVDRFGPELLRRAQAHGDERARTIAIEAAEPVATAVARERKLVADAGACDSLMVQAGLFDSRALKEKAAADRRRSVVWQESKARADSLAGDSNIRVAHSPLLTMLLIRCSRG